MEDKSEEINIPASSADCLKQRSFPESEILCTSRRRLTLREREIAITAISARASGSPVEAAKQVLAGIAVIDGDHLPILVWPKDVTREEKAAWHDNEADFWRESAKRFSVLNSDARNDQQSPRIPEGVSQNSSPDQPLPYSTLAAPAHCEVEEENLPRPLSGEPAQGSSDAC